MTYTFDIAPKLEPEFYLEKKKNKNKLNLNYHPTLVSKY